MTTTLRGHDNLALTRNLDTIAGDLAERVSRHLDPVRHLDSGHGWYVTGPRYAILAAARAVLDDLDHLPAGSLIAGLGDAEVEVGPYGNGWRLVVVQTAR